MKLQKAQLLTPIAKNLRTILLILKGTLKQNYRAPARALVARNLKGSLLSLKWTINSKILCVSKSFSREEFYRSFAPVKGDS